MDATLLASVAGIILSLLFAYVPKLDVWYAQLDGTFKRLIMLALLLVTAIGAFGLSCADIWPTVTCDKAGAIGLLQAFVMAMIANQSAYPLLPRTRRVERTIAANLSKKLNTLDSGAG